MLLSSGNTWLKTALLNLPPSLVSFLPFHLPSLFILTFCSSSYNFHTPNLSLPISLTLPHSSPLSLLTFRYSYFSPIHSLDLSHSSPLISLTPHLSPLAPLSQPLTSSNPHPSLLVSHFPHSSHTSSSHPTVRSSPIALDSQGRTLIGNLSRICLPLQRLDNSYWTKKMTRLHHQTLAFTAVYDQTSPSDTGLYSYIWPDFTIKHLAVTLRHDQTSTLIILHNHRLSSSLHIHLQQ